MTPQFPRLVYKDAATHKPVVSEVELNEAFADGWFASVPEALGRIPTVRQAARQQIDRAPGDRRVDTATAETYKGRKNKRHTVRRVDDRKLALAPNVVPAVATPAPAASAPPAAPEAVPAPVAGVKPPWG